MSKKYFITYMYVLKTRWIHSVIMSEMIAFVWLEDTNI